MSQYTFQDIEEFILDDRLFHWAKAGSTDSGFDIELYKQQHPGSEEKIELAIAMIRGLKVVEENEATSQAYKMQRFTQMMSRHRQQQQQQRTLRTKKALGYVASIAAMLFICIGSYYFLFEAKRGENTDLTAAVMDSLNRFGQVQILLDGKQAAGFDQNNAEIRVDKDGAITVDGKQVAASKGREISVNQVVVPYGKRSKIILPDGSSLWINAGSCISYHSDFAKNRKLNVQGEVFLDVKRDENHPFIVKTNHLEVRVLGTAFNVTDYSKDSQPAVVLVRGSVDVKVDNKENKRLSPNQRLAMENGIVEVCTVDVYNYICWKDDVLNFDGKPLSYILRSLSRYYDTKIEVTSEIEDEICYGSLDLNCSIDEVLESISLTTPLKVERKGEILYIIPN